MNWYTVSLSGPYLRIVTPHPFSKNQMPDNRKRILIALPRPLAGAITTLARTNRRSTRKEIQVAVEKHVAEAVSAK